MTINQNNSNAQITVPILYGAGTRWEFTHNFSGDIFDVYPDNLSSSPLFWTISLDGGSFPYTGVYTVKIYRLTGESIWTGVLNVTKELDVTTFDQNNTRDNVIFN